MLDSTLWHWPAIAFVISLSGLAACQRGDLLATAQPSAAASTGAPPTSLAIAPPSSSPSAPAPPHDDPHIPLPGPARQRLASAVAENASCEACHDDVTREWRGSYHQRADVDPAYRKAFAIEPSPFCRSCHAPEADPRKEPSVAVSALGVGCVTCHVTEPGIVLAAAHPDEPADPGRPPAPHPLRRSNEFASVGGCAGCHELRFPIPGGDDDAFFMQTTVREHRRSSTTAKPCAECHMPRRRGLRSHAFAEVRDEAWLRKGLQATAERTPDDTVRILLVQPAPGHAFPTGDLFRRLEIGYELTEVSGKVLHRATRYLARHFDSVPGFPGRHLSGDDRVESEPVSVELEVPPPADAQAPTQLSWWVTYQRVATIGKGTNPADATIESEVKLHAGSLSWTTTPTPMKQP